MGGGVGRLRDNNNGDVNFRIYFSLPILESAIFFLLFV